MKIVTIDTTSNRLTLIISHLRKPTVPIMTENVLIGTPSKWLALIINHLQKKAVSIVMKIVMIDTASNFKRVSRESAMRGF